MVEECTGLKISEIGDEIRVSGSLEKHYSPRATVDLNAEAKTGEGLIALDVVPTPSGVVRLASPKNADEFARVMYAALRDADAKGIKKVVAITPEGDGIAIAIRDRLERASKGR
jgi:L-threonylcarbamoyladenylate synthase